MDGNRFNGRTDGSSPFDGLRQGSQRGSNHVQDAPATTEAAEPDIIIGLTRRQKRRTPETCRHFIFLRNGQRKTV